MISLGNNVVQNVEERSFVCSAIPNVMDGADVIDTLCPVSEKTGLRENLLSLVRKLISDPAKQALLMPFLQQQPSDNSQSLLTDEDRFELCSQRLCTGTPAENDVLRDSLMSIFEHSSSMLSSAKEVAEKATIKFDSPSVEPSVSE